MSVICFGCGNNSLKHIGLVYSNVFLRQLATSAATAPVNHYKTLGLTAKATQTEIKSAYYNLSKVFHPDVSGENQEAAIKFRQITSAYEILGNVKLRKMYDRGLLPHDSTFYPQEGFDEESDERKPSSPYKRTRSQPMTGRTEHYNFDEWSRLHYGFAMNRKKAAKASKEARDAERVRADGEVQSDKMLSMVILSLLVLTCLGYAGSTNYDNPMPKKPT